MKAFLTHTKTLKILFLLALLMTAAFGLIMHVWDFVLIDEMYNRDQILAHLNQLTQTQKTAHQWMTATLDVAYPLVYGGLFIGLAWRCFERHGSWLAVPSMMVIPVDLAEGLVQVLLLSGDVHLVGYKTVITPIKLVLFSIGLMISLAGLFVAFRNKKRT